MPLPSLVMVATLVEDEVQVTKCVRSAIVPSGNLPVAVKFWLPLMVTTGSTGETVMTLGAFTFICVMPLRPPKLAVIVAGVVPVCRAVARPDELMLTMVTADEVQVALAVRSCVEPSL